MRTEMLVLALLAIPATTAAQELSIRFRAPRGLRTQVVSDTRVNTVVVGFPSLPDSTVIESTWRTVSTQRVLDVLGPSRVVSVVFDSSRARSKVGTSPRNDVMLSGVEGMSARWVLSERMEGSGRTGGQAGDSAFLDALTVTAGGFAFALPDTLISVGGEWSALFRFPLGAHMSAGGRIASAGSIGGRGTAKLDSIMPRGADTLAFITVRAATNPTPLVISAEGGVGGGMFSGGFSAALVWSTGWNAVVSAATNGLVSGTVSIDRAEGPPVNGALTLTIAGRHQVRL